MINQTIVIKNTTPSAVYDALLSSEAHSQIIGDKATIDPVIGGYYSTFSGYADGQTTNLIPDKLIEQTWRADDWGFDEYSTIKFELKAVDEGTEIHFTQAGIPEGREREYEEGWQDNYWTNLQDYFDKSISGKK